MKVRGNFVDFRSSLIFKMTIAYLVFVFIPILIISNYVITKNNDYSIISASNDGREKLNQISNNFDKELFMLEKASKMLAYNKDITNYIEKNSSKSDTDSTNYFENIYPIISNAATITGYSEDSFRIYTYRGFETSIGAFSNYKEISNLNWVMEFLSSSQEGIWIYNQIDKEKNERYFVRINKIKNSQNNVFGLVVIKINVNTLISSVKNYLANQKNTGIALIDYKGRPIYIINDFYSPNSNIIITLQDFDSAQQIKENILDASAFSKDYFLGKDNINVYMKNTNLELYIVAQYSLQKYYESQNSAIFLIQTFFTVILLFLILFYILLMYIFYKLKSNIRQVGEIINNNFEGRLKVTGRDELQKNAAQINEMLVNIRELISKIISKEKLAYDAEMKALLNQINPHFIYNTINIFIMKLEVEGSFEVAEAIAKFGKILRYNIETNSELTTIKEDVAVLKDYMDLLKLRFDDEFSYIVDIPPDILDSKILRFVLQPIVENCFKHGRQAGKHLCVSIYAVRDNRDIRIYINDNGRGMSQLLIDALNQAFETSNYQSIKKITRKMNGNIGLMNTNERIKLHYGNEYHLSVEGKEDSYSTFIIHLKSEE